MVSIVIMGVVAYCVSAQWLPLIATAVTGYLGYKAAQDANKTQKEALQSQQSFEAEQAARMAEMQKQQTDLANAMAFGGDFTFGEGDKAKTQTFTGAAGAADDWTQKYLNWLQTSPDLEYNQQRGRLERDFATGLEAASSRAKQAGATSGYAGQQMGQLAMARAGALGGMESDRSARAGQRLAAGSQLTQGLLDRALNMRQSALGMPAPAQTMVPQMIQGIAQQQAGQAGALGGASSAFLNLWLQQQRNRTSTTAPTQAPIVSPIAGWQNQFQDFRLRG